MPLLLRRGVRPGDVTVDLIDVVVPRRRERGIFDNFRAVYESNFVTERLRERTTPAETPAQPAPQPNA